MRLLELFSGTKSVSKYAESIGFETITLDYDPKHQADYCMDILEIDDAWLETFVKKHGKIDIVHMSPDCRHYSKIRYNWKAMGHPEPDLEYADSLVRKALYIKEYLNPTFWFLENPATGQLKNRGLLDGVPMKRCCYCKYDSDGTFMTKKETAIWGCVDDWTPRMCNKEHGHCEAKAKYGKHLEGLGHSKSISREVPRSQRIRIPPQLVKELIDSVLKNEKPNQNAAERAPRQEKTTKHGN